MPRKVGHAVEDVAGADRGRIFEVVHEVFRILLGVAVIREHHHDQPPRDSHIEGLPTLRANPFPAKAVTHDGLVVLEPAVRTGQFHFKPSSNISM